MAKLEEFRGSKGNLSAYAPKYIRDRAGGFAKDVDICLTGVSHRNSGNLTHAYFPALSICFGFLEHTAAAHSGKRIRKVGDKEIVAWAAAYLPQPDYDAQVVKLFYNAFRHSVNHRGIADGVWLDRSSNPQRRITWNLYARSSRPSFTLVEDPGELRNDPPWVCPYTHRAHISLRSLKVDLTRGARRYAADIPQNQELLQAFKRFVVQIYPPGE